MRAAARASARSGCRFCTFYLRQGTRYSAHSDDTQPSRRLAARRLTTRSDLLRYSTTMRSLVYSEHTVGCSCVRTVTLPGRCTLEPGLCLTLVPVEPHLRTVDHTTTLRLRYIRNNRPRCSWQVGNTMFTANMALGLVGRQSWEHTLPWRS